jgi:hypothetical protein
MLKCARIVAASLVSALVIAACGHREEAAEAPAPAATETPASPAAPLEERTSALPFRLDVSFSPAAAGQLEALAERVVIDAYYYGTPKPGFEPDEPGDVGVDLGDEVLEVDAGNRSVTLNGRFSPVQLAREVSGEPRVLVNVYSARLSGPDNLLSCGIVDEALPLLAETGASIACSLIEE